MNKAAICGLCGAAAVMLGYWHAGQEARAQDQAAGLEVVEPSMHEFMEYVFEPFYKRLHAALASEPADKAGWKPVKGDALVLAEACNLLAARSPDDASTAQWRQLAAGVQREGKLLYEAAKKREYAPARQHYEAMLKRCNACHTAFADGKHQLTP